MRFFKVGIFSRELDNFISSFGLILPRAILVESRSISQNSLSAERVLCWSNGSVVNNSTVDNRLLIGSNFDKGFDIQCLNNRPPIGVTVSFINSNSVALDVLSWIFSNNSRLLTAVASKTMVLSISNDLIDLIWLNSENCVSFKYLIKAPAAEIPGEFFSKPYPLVVLTLKWDNMRAFADFKSNQSDVLLVSSIFSSKVISNASSRFVFSFE